MTYAITPGASHPVQFSTLTSNAVIMRLANNFSTESIRFW